MIILMLNANGESSFRFEEGCFTSYILILDLYIIGPFDFLVDPRKAQAPFLVENLSAFIAKDRIDKNLRIKFS